MIGYSTIYNIFYSYVISLVLFVLILIKIIAKVTEGVCRSNRRMDGKTVIVTGANTGLGKGTAMELSRRGARVILGCRDLKRGNKARDEIISVTGNNEVILHHLELTSLSSVREFARIINGTENRLDVLINNAGSAGLEYDVTEDGLEVQMHTNYFGPFLLTILLIDLLKKSSPSRIIIVSSLMHFIATLRIDNINKRKTFHRVMAYDDSKLATILWANELAERLKGTGVTCNSLHPGLVLTDIWRNTIIGWILFKIILRVFCKNVHQGIQTAIHLAVSEEVEGVSGKFFSDCKEFVTSRTAQDKGLAKKLWEKSEELVKLQPSEKLYLQ